MSEKEGGNEEEKVILHHFYHHHPLTLDVVRLTYATQCYGCRNYIFSGETAYTCLEDKCRWDPIVFHEECAEMPREITLSLHPQHALVQKEVSYVPKRAVCEGRIRRIGYYCSSSSDDPCQFQIHVGCARSTDIIHAAAGERSCMKHPSHPQHELSLLRRPGQSVSLRCDACGIVQRGNSYICITCQYWIHESCAALPPTLSYQHHAAHELSLVYQLPQEYIKFNFQCKVCFKNLLPRNWAYHCGICRYIVHIKCATQKYPPTTTSNIDANDVITFPVNNVVKELIEAFVRKLGGMVNVPNEKEMVKGKYKFHNPYHQLLLVSSSSLNDQEEEKEEEREERIKNCNTDDDDDDDDDETEEDDDLYHEKVSKLVCDVCTEPIIIFEKSSCSNNKKYSNYISCSECKFFVHVACFQLPDELPSSHIHKPDHTLTLQTTPEFDFSLCRSCRVNTNGLIYQCNNCDFRADIKCVSLPATIKHAAHPHHLLNLLSDDTTSESSYVQRLCGACDRDTIIEVCYRCEICGLIFHSRCCLLPPQIINRRYDKHPLRLTFDATVNRPGEFYCDVCEKQMNPRMWMYHCRECDVSIHPDCFPSMSDEYRNIKFGGRYVAAARHPHTLRFQPLTNSRKPRCNVCGTRLEYGTLGFQCCSDECDCDFFMCYGHHGMGGLQAVDS